jgi:hypothetical protein
VVENSSPTIVEKPHIIIIAIENVRDFSTKRNLHYFSPFKTTFQIKKLTSPQSESVGKRAPAAAYYL